MARTAGSLESLGAILRFVLCHQGAATDHQTPRIPCLPRPRYPYILLADTIIAQLEDPKEIQRDKLAALRPLISRIRGYHDGDYARVVRAIKKRLNSPKLVEQVEAFLTELDAGRVAIPPPPADRPPPPPPPAPTPSPVISDDTTAAVLEAEIARDPDPPSAYLAYGDYLEARGEPWAGLIAIGRELAKNPGHKDMLRAHAELATKLLGPLADCLDLVTEIEWHMGFIKRCRLAYTIDRFNGKGSRVQLHEVLAMLVDDPAPGRFLQHLVVGLVLHDDNTYTKVCDVLAKQRRPLRSLILGDFGQDECELNWANLGDISSLWAAVPELRELVLRAGSMTLGPMSLPKLRTLKTITGGLDPASLGYIAQADWPELVDLDLQIGVAHEGAATSVEPLAPLLAAERVPKLRRLAITNCEFADELVVQLAHSKLLPQLEQLDVSMGTLTDVGLDAIEANRGRFAHLTKLVVNVEQRDYTQVGQRRPLLVGTNVEIVWDDRYGPVYE